MPKSLRILIWFAVAVLGALAVATIALHRGEQINAMWLVVAAICTYAVGYRFYSKFIAAKVLTLDAQRATPAERLPSAQLPISSGALGRLTPRRLPKINRDR